MNIKKLSFLIAATIAVAIASCEESTPTPQPDSLEEVDVEVIDHRWEYIFHKVKKNTPWFSKSPAPIGPFDDPGAVLVGKSYRSELVQDVNCFCQSKSRPVDHRKVSHLRQVDHKLIIEKSAS